MGDNEAQMKKVSTKDKITQKYVKKIFIFYPKTIEIVWADRFVFKETVAQVVYTATE